ncbi:EAL domain-containing protein [Desulfovibrio sp. OttesenSCG-928-I05]|nr:EAL domain-containing protein [Desulfovibrio sp. OttesenSCG-928-I05]
MNTVAKQMLTQFENRFLPLAEGISSQPTLRAIRAALIITLPIVFLGSLAELLNSFPLPAYKAFMAQYFGPDWRLFGQSIKNGTFAVMSLIMLFSLGQHLAERFNASNPLTRTNPVVAGLISFVSFLSLLQEPLDGSLLTSQWLGVSGLFVAMMVGLLATNLFLFLFSRKKLHLRLPGGTPDASIPQAFNALIPGMLTVLIFASIGTAVYSLSGISIHQAVHNLIRLPFDLIGDGLSRGMLYILSLHGLWFAGIHGANVLDPITHHIYGAAITANEIAAAAGEPLPHVMTKTFMDIFVFMGGAGCSLSLAGALLLFGKSQADKKLGAISLVPGIFNINEVLMFGLPIVLNPLMLIPFIATPLLLAAISYIAVSTGIVPGTSTLVEWTTPIFLNSYMSTGSIRGPILQLVNLSIGILVYAPFVVLSNKISAKRTQAAFGILMDRATATHSSGARVIDQHDDAGSLARNLLTDLSYDHEAGTGLYLEFQPQVAAESGRVVGVESLIRWRHELYGSIPAPITVTLAEDSALIRSIGLWVFDTACRTRRAWLDKGVTELVTAVNVSALQLLPDLPEEFMKRLGHYGLAPNMIELEVTESSALDADTPESKVLSGLYELGFPVAIDDFGMGHSSLKYLKQFPVSTVKIDGAISKEVVTNPICADIVASITRLCRARRMTSVAEFVETDEQAAVLRNLGCDVFQGYRYSKPLHADACLRFILENQQFVPAHAAFDPYCCVVGQDVAS